MKLSIIIPVYNVEKYLEKCLNSVIYPGLGNYEIIIVNDGSSDSSPSIAESYAEKYPSLIRIVNKENGGLGSARNAGLEIARGEYVQFLDSDDYLSENAVPEMLEAAAQDFDIVIFDYVSVNELGREFDYCRGCEKDGSFSLDEYPQLLFDSPSACNKLIRRRLFSNNSIVFPDRIWFEDLCTIPKLYPHARRISAVPKAWYKYLRRPGSITNTASAGRNSEMLQVCSSVLDYYRSLGQYEKYSAELEYMCAYNELLTSSTRVNLADRRSPVQDELVKWFKEHFPDYQENKYVKAMPGKYRLLIRLIMNRKRVSLNLIMRLNNFVKKKDR